MSDFELRRQLQSWRTEMEPERDLWPAVAARIDGTRPIAARSHRWAWPEGLAAGIVVALGVGLFGLHPVATETTRPLGTAVLIERSYAGALAEAGAWAPTRGSGPVRRAQVELDGAQAGLEAALAAHPDSPALLALLQRTHEQRLRVARLSARTG
jgi:hypothetical protein